jgi:hypothetical protein
MAKHTPSPSRRHDIENFTVKELLAALKDKINQADKAKRKEATKARLEKFRK